MPDTLSKRTLFRWLLLALLALLLALPAAAGAQGPIPTNEWVNFYGLNTLLNGAPVPPGAVITAYDPQGVLCGQFVVHTAGRYGVMPVYRDDPMTATDEGASPGDTITFRINGLPATALGPGLPRWTANGDVIQVELSAGGAVPPTNTPVPPTNTPVPPANTATPTRTFTPVPPTATPAAPTATFTAVPPATSTPGTTPPEWVNFYGENSTYDGGPLPVGARVEAWSTDGVKCGEFVVTQAGRYGLLACYRAPNGQPGVQPGENVIFTVNGRAARTLGPDAAVWTEMGARLHVELDVPPLTPFPTATATRTPTPTPAGGTSVPPEWVNFYGTATTYYGAPVPPGALVEAFAPDGTKCGQFVVTTAGQYGVLPCVRAPLGVPGAHPGDTISFKINGRPANARGPDSAVWTTNGDVRHVELEVPPLTPIPTNTPAPTATSTPSGPPGSPEWVNFYGINTIYEGQPIPVGAVVRAWSPDGVECGSFTVTEPGKYGLLACMGAPIGLPGAHPGDTIYFTINGRAALAVGPDSPVWTTNGDLRHVELFIPLSTPTPCPICTATPTPAPGTPTPTLPAPTPTSTATVPGATMTPAPTPTPGGLCSQGIVYTVRWGDWLYKIAQCFGVSVQDILYCNYLPNPNYLRPGQQLFIPGVTPTPAPTPGATPTPCPSTVYIVRPGDTLSGIAWRFGTTVRAIMAANGLVNPNYIYVGQRLTIPTCGDPPPSGRTYIVQYGDSLWKIAMRFGVSMWRLAVVNNLYYPYIIYPGQVLVIP
jgi:LysM repeat protein